MQNEERALRVVPLEWKPVNMTTEPDNQKPSRTCHRYKLSQVSDLY